MGMKPAMKDDGFTLIEVLAALMVFSIALIGLTRAGTESARAVGVIEDKMLAGIVADNQLTLARIDQLKNGTQSGHTVLMSRPFEYEISTSKTDVTGFFRVIVKVRHENSDQVIVERTAFRQN